MTSAPSTYPCPRCGTTASAGTGCPGCGRAPDADAIEVMRLDAEIAGLRQRFDAARAELTTLQTRIGDVTAQRNRIAYRVVTKAKAEKPVTEPAVINTPEPQLTTLTVQNVLFALGGLLLIVAAAVFTAVAWAQVGVTGRAAILATATVAVLAVPPFAVRRGLTAAAETLAAVGLLMILLDGYAAWAVNVLDVRGQDPQLYAAAVCAATAVIASGYGRLTRLPGPAISALAVAQPVLPLLALAADAGVTGWSLTLAGVTALNLAVVHARRYSPTGLGLVAYVCAFAAGIVAALIALVDLVSAGTATEAATAGGLLVLVTALATTSAVLAGNREAQTVTAGLLTAAVSVTAAAWSLLLGAPALSAAIDEGTGVLRLAVVALVVAALVAAIRPRLPQPVGRGPWAAALLTAAVPALGAAGAILIAAVNTVDAARPVFDAPLGLAVGEPDWTLLVATVAVLCAYALLVKARQRTDLALIAVAGVAVLAPAAFRLPWWTAVIMAMIVAAGAIALATRTRGTRRRPFRITLAALLAGYALLVSMGNPAVGAAACLTLTLLAATTAYFVRTEPGSNALGSANAAVSLLAFPPAVWLALMAADVPVTWQVRAELVVAAGFAVATRLTPWYRSAALTVSLLVTTLVPVVARAGEDAVALYAAVALVLVAAALPPEAVRPVSISAAPAAPISGRALPGGVPAAIVPLLVLLFATGRDLAAVLIEPYRALESFWSGDVPEVPSARWSSIAALLIVAGAAAFAAVRLTSRSAFRPAFRLAFWAAAPVLAVVVPLVFAAVEAPWPAVPLAGLVTGLAGIVALALTGSAGRWGAVPAVVLTALAAAGLAGTTPVRGAMLAAFALVVVAGAVAGVSGRAEAARAGGWVTGAVSVVVVAYTASQMVDLGPGSGPLSVLTAAAIAAALEFVLAARRPREAPAVAAVAHSAALIALLVAGTTGRAALIATLWALVLGLRALRPGERAAVRFRHTVAAAVSVLAGWWLFLGSRDVTTVEIYTLPAAALALGAGWLARRGRPSLPSWSAYGPALAAGFLPTLAMISSGGPEYPRRLLLGVAAVLVLLAGARARLQAPVVTGGVMLVLTALHELVQFWDLVPRWVPLAAGGLLLVGTATTMEQRRRDVLRLRNAVGRMS
ncbi:SCO7613 C-terminal domain-containing membrane protein [Actinoplanes sp. CA-015351]|uniref:SCO7613 C-terminal domain-containing membrane protein n=1 Tax=Actinoplanes sp. CA-015351 TaxID=3239897 RepID=UPI003D98DE6F